MSHKCNRPKFENQNDRFCSGAKPVSKDKLKSSSSKSDNDLDAILGHICHIGKLLASSHPIHVSLPKIFERHSRLRKNISIKTSPE